MLTSVADFLGAVASFWLALYLPGRSFPGRVAWRAVGLLLCLSFFFLLEHVSLYATSAGQAAVRSILLVIALAAWNDVAYRILLDAHREVAAWRVGAIYIFAALSALVLISARGAFAESQAGALWLPKMERQPGFAILAGFILCACASILYSCWVAQRRGASAKHIYFQLASVLIAGGAGCALAAAAAAVRVPRGLLDAMVLCSVVLLAISVARSEGISPPRTPSRNLPISALAAVCLSVVYVFLASRVGVAPVGLPLAAGLAILTHSAYDRVLDHLERLKLRDTNAAGERDQPAGTGNGAPAPIAPLDPEFIGLVEQGLRNLTDCIALGKSHLPEALHMRGETHIEMGKAVQQRLLQAIEELRPVQGLSKNPLPRECYSYVVLHDAYWVGTPNRDIMSRLQISEGTFHRTRREAVRAVARSLLEARGTDGN